MYRLNVCILGLVEGQNEIVWLIYQHLVYQRYQSQNVQDNQLNSMQENMY